MNKIFTIMLIGLILTTFLSIIQPICFCEINNVKIFYVGGVGQGNFSNLQYAINKSSNGDIIFIYNGVYNENIYINKSIDLIGENRNNTIIEGKKEFVTIIINSSFVNISNLKIKNSLICGILIENSTNCSIYHNLIDDNTYGINIFLSNNISISYNTISNCSNIGLEIIKNRNLSNTFNCSENNIIYHNNFINNSKHAYDECHNIWFYNKEGNYWDNYTGLDKNNDGIGDEPIRIIGNNNYDKYPLMIPYYGRIMYKEFYVDENTLYLMLLISIIVVIIFIIPIAIYWRKKNLSK